MWQHGLVTLQNCEESVMVIAILQSTIILASVFDKCEMWIFSLFPTTTSTRK